MISKSLTLWRIPRMIRALTRSTGRNSFRCRWTRPRPTSLRLLVLTCSPGIQLLHMLVGQWCDHRRERPRLLHVFSMGGSGVKQCEFEDADSAHWRTAHVGGRGDTTTVSGLSVRASRSEREAHSWGGSIHTILRTLPGVEFSVVHAMPPDCFVIHKRERLSPTEG